MLVIYCYLFRFLKFNSFASAEKWMNENTKIVSIILKIFMFFIWLIIRQTDSPIESAYDKLEALSK